MIYPLQLASSSKAGKNQYIDQRQRKNAAQKDRRRIIEDGSMINQHFDLKSINQTSWVARNLFEVAVVPRTTASSRGTVSVMWKINSGSHWLLLATEGSDFSTSFDERPNELK